MQDAAWLRLDADTGVHGAPDPLFATQIPLGCLPGNMPEKELNLLQFTTGRMAQLCARTPQVVRGQLREPELVGVLFHDVPDHSFRYAVTPVFACTTNASEQSSVRYSGRIHRDINRRFDPLGHGHSANVAAFAKEINDGPMFLALLQMREV